MVVNFLESHGMRQYNHRHILNYAYIHGITIMYNCNTLHTKERAAPSHVLYISNMH